MKALFFSIHLREKLLLIGLLALVAVTWLTGVTRRGHTLWVEWRTVAAKLATQQQWLDNRASIEAAATKAVEHLDPARTFSSQRLMGELSTIADRVGVRDKTSSTNLPTEQANPFQVNAVQFAIRNTDLASVINFYDELEKRAPYIGIEQFTLNVGATTQAQLSVNLKVSSVEILR